MSKGFNSEKVEISQLAKELYELSESTFDYGSPWNLEQFLSQLNSPHHVIESIWQDSQCIGFILYESIYDTADLLLLVVSKNHQNQGIAHSLLQKSSEKLSEEGVNRIVLEVRESNQPAISFYSKESFEEIGIRKKYYQHPTENARIMERYI